MNRDWQKYFAEVSREAAKMGARADATMHGDVNPMPSYAGEVSGNTNPTGGPSFLSTAGSSVKSKLSSVATAVKNAGSKAHTEVKTWRLGEWGSLASIIGIGLWTYDQFTPGGLRGRRK